MFYMLLSFGRGRNWATRANQICVMFYNLYLTHPSQFLSAQIEFQQVQGFAWKITQLVFDVICKGRVYQKVTKL